MKLLTNHLKHKSTCSGEELEEFFYEALKRTMVRCKNCQRMVVAIDAETFRKF